MERLAENMELIYDQMSDLVGQVKGASGNLDPAMELLAYHTGILIATKLPSEILKYLNQGSRCVMQLRMLPNRSWVLQYTHAHVS